MLLIVTVAVAVTMTVTMATPQVSFQTNRLLFLHELHELKTKTAIGLLENLIEEKNLFCSSARLQRKATKNENDIFGWPQHLLFRLSTSDNKYDMLTNKNSKLLIYHFSNYLDRQLRLVKRARHTIIFEDEHGLHELQWKGWPYLIGKVLAMSQKVYVELQNEEEKDLENKLLLDVINIFDICKHFYDTLYNSAVTNVRQMIVNSSYSLSMKPTLRWWGGLPNQEISSSPSTRRARRRDATTSDKNKQIFSMLMPTTWFKVKKFRLE